MDVGRNRIDALCRRQCAFALYRLPGEQEEVRFCMQEDGGLSPWSAGEDGFLLAPFDGAAGFIRREFTDPPSADGYPILNPDAPETPSTTPEAYARLFELYKAQMPTPLRKIVLARAEDVEKRPDFSPHDVFCQLCGRFPLQFNVLLHTVEHGTWLCSTPELLLCGAGSDWQTMALAGTRPAGDDEDRPWDAKNRSEQQLVTDYIAQCLEPLWVGGTLVGPSTLRTGTIEHLCTRFHFRMDAGKLGELLGTLPPTPAVCGSPPEAARAWLRAQPDIERGLYAGYIGPVGPCGVQLFVTLRCMRLYTNCCRLFAGGGLMPDSSPESEWLETQSKMRCMRQLLQG